MKNRKYLPTIAELIDRLSIIQLKEVFISEHKEEYAEEIKDIVHDLDLLMNWEKPSGEMIRAIIVLAQMNLHIWHNETKYRAGEGDGNLGLTHGLNGIRNTAKNIIIMSITMRLILIRKIRKAQQLKSQSQFQSPILVIIIIAMTKSIGIK